MTRSALARFLPLTMLLAFAACESSSTAPVTAPAPNAHMASTGQELVAPQHKGGTASETIGFWGGSVSFTDRSAKGMTFRLDVPAGAVYTPTLFRMTVLPGTTYRVDLTAKAGSYDVGKHGFGIPVRLTISYGSASIFNHYPSKITVAWFPESGSPVPQYTTMDVYRKSVTGYLPHFTKYGLIMW